MFIEDQMVWDADAADLQDWFVREYLMFSLFGEGV